MKFQIHLPRHVISPSRLNIDCTHTHSRNTMLEKDKEAGKVKEYKGFVFSTEYKVAVS